ncbi:OLC1v1013697C1 [Oldenlandia corymbosa var. corymbosa]|uniref:OLC1v1013697C1 n=1 Tax=Oldenlandia corymbosa var. corymbosa TaxID=529605 RepID=A0AAV1DZR6_OLDCO|nr:OLC1v1013697C1 [Oldenlandia corymbosa var. corymbosa]
MWSRLRDMVKHDPFRIALNEVDLIANRCPEDDFKKNTKLLGVQLRLLRSFCKCGKMWVKREHHGSTLLNIEDIVHQHGLKIQYTGIKIRFRAVLLLLFSKFFGGIHQFICLRFRGHDGDDDDPMISDTATILDRLCKWRSKLISCVHWSVCLRLCNHATNLWHLHSEYLSYIQHLSFAQETVELYHLFSDSTLRNISSIEEIPFFLDIIDSLLQNSRNLKELNHNSSYVEWLQVCAKFLKNLIIFAISRGLGVRQMGSLLAHTQLFLVDALHDLYMFGCNKDSQYIAQLNIRGLPIKSARRARGIYIGVLQASKLSLSYYHFTPANCRVTFGNFVDSLLTLLWSLLGSEYSSSDIFNHQIQELYGGLTFLRTIMLEQPDKFEVLYEKMPTLIGLVICESGITIIHLFGKGKRCFVKKLEILFSKTAEYFGKLIEAVKGEDLQLMLASNFPQTNLLGFIDRLLEKLMSVIRDDAHSSVSLSKDDLQTLHDTLTDIRSSLAVLQFNQNGKFQALRSRIAAVVYETEFFLDSLTVEGNEDSVFKIINNITTAVKLISAEASDIFLNQNHITKIAEASHKMLSAGEIPVLDDSMVGLDDEVEKVIDRLTRGTEQLDIVSIVGMPGLGKTMLAKKVYEDLSIVLHFHVQSWCTISQVYNKRSLLIEILSGLVNFEDKYSEMDEDDLSLMLYQQLKGRKYFIILDDIWDLGAWVSLSSSFPNDVNGSRILLTSRHHNVAFEIKPDREPHHLRLLHIDESWELMQKIIGVKERLPPELFACGMEIVQDCSGLPLMILVVAGLLSNMNPNTWEEVRESLKKGTLSLAEKCTESIELSYSYLPDHLKDCFLYFGAFGEDKQIPVRKLLQIWIAEGFVQKNGRGYSEDVAEGYMRELIQRNLIMVGKKGSRGTVKTCIIHDMLRDFCIAKCNEEHFLHQLRGYEPGKSVDPSILYRLHLCSRMREDFAESRLLCPRLHTLFLVVDNDVLNLPRNMFLNCDHDVLNSRRWYSLLYRFKQSKLLRVLDLRMCYTGSSFPVVIESLVHLRYLALQIAGTGLKLPPSIGNLLNLETLIILTTGNIWLPDTIWNMKSLKHLCVTGWFAHWILPDSFLEGRSNLENLRTLSAALFISDITTMEVMRKFPNIRRLKYRCINSMSSEIIALDFLSQLESLTISDHQTSGDLNFQFPQNLKKLTLANLHLPWSKISSFDRLPNLEVLKLQDNAFTGENWDLVEEGTFPKLRFLKLEGLDLARWTDSNESFPCLEKLVLVSCHHLEELPSSLAQSSTLQMIEVKNCKHVAASINQIQEEHMCWGSEDLNIRVVSLDERERVRDWGRLLVDLCVRLYNPLLLNRQTQIFKIMIIKIVAFLHRH